MGNVYPAARYRTAGTNLANGTKTAVLTIGAGPRVWADVTGITICASTGTAGGTATIAWYDNNTTTEHVLAYQLPVPAVGNLHIEFDPLHMDASDELRVTGAANQNVTVSLIDGGAGA